MTRMTRMVAGGAPARVAQLAALLRRAGRRLFPDGGFLWPTILQRVRLAQPVGQRRLDLIAMDDVQDVGALGARALDHLPDLRGSHFTVEEEHHLEPVAAGTHEEVARFPREHDRVVRRVDALLAELRRGLPQALPCVTQLL